MVGVLAGCPACDCCCCPGLRCNGVTMWREPQLLWVVPCVRLMVAAVPRLCWWWLSVCLS